MSNFLRLLKAQFKRAVKLYPVILAFTLILALGAALLLGGMIGARNNSSDNKKLQIGLVGDTSDSYLGIGVFAIQNFDSSKDYVSLVNMDEAEAVAKLDKGEISGYVLIPEDLVNDLVYGRDTTIKYVTVNRPAMLGTMVVEEIAGMLSNIIATSNNGAVGLQELTKKTLLSSEERGALVDEMCLDFFDIVLNRESLYKVNFLGYSNNLSFTEYYVCAFFIIILLLWGTVCVNLLTKPDLSFERQLLARGRGPVEQILSEFLPFFAVISVNVILGFGIFGMATEFFGLSVGDFSFSGSLGSCLATAFALLPAVALVCILQLLLYEFCASVISAVLLQILSIIALSFASGFIFPLYSLPQTLQNISGLLPTSAAFEYSAVVFTQKGTIGALVPLTVNFIILFAGVCFVRYFKLRSNRL